jgi:hypothetical protein
LATGGTCCEITIVAVNDAGFSCIERLAIAGPSSGRAVVLHADVAELAKTHQPDYPFSGLDTVISPAAGFRANNSVPCCGASGVGLSCSVG